MKKMKTNNIKKFLLLVAITILLVGLVSAAQTNKTSTTKNTKVVKDNTKTSVKTATKTIKEPAKKVTNNKNVTKKEITKKPTNQTKKSESNTFDVSNFNALHSTLTDTYEAVITINIKSEIKLTDNTEVNNVINKVIINGNGKTINGDKKYKFLHIKHGTQVTINNLKITQCHGNSGGAIYNMGNLIINNCEFKENKAEHYGGAIDNDYDMDGYTYLRGKVNIENSKFINNKANEAGGAIYNIGSLNETKNKYENNTAEYGGALFNDWGGYAHIENNNYKNNEATESGGVIYAKGDYDEIEIINTNLTENTAKYGSAIYLYGDTLTINDSTFKNNDATMSTYTILSNKFITNMDDYSTYFTIKNSEFIREGYTSKDTEISIDGFSEISNTKYTITPTNTKITLKLNTTKLYKGSKVNATVTLKDKKGNILENQKITIKFGTKTYTLKTNSEGTATKTYQTTKTGTIKVTSTFKGTTLFKKSTKTSNMKVLPKIKTKLTLKLSKTKAKVNDKIKVKITLKNKSNKAIKNQKVTVKIGSKTYNKKTNKKGVISFTFKVVKSALGKAIKATYKGNYMYLNSKASKKLLKA